MATSEVFRPSNGDLLVRDFMSHGPALSSDVFRKEEHRPQTHGGYRFGRLSHNSFFTRHNPHPSRVKHIKGLLGVPICTVNDDGYFANPRYSLQFPPNSFDSQKVKNWKGRTSVDDINFNRHIPAYNTGTGLQHFPGLNNYPFKEKAIPRVGLVPVTETWRDELLAFTRALELDQNGNKDPAASKPEDGARPRTTVYSPETGRIIPPPSRAMSRGQSRRGQTSHQFSSGNMQHIFANPDWENLVLMMLCQILQTDDVNAVQAWLCSAGEREEHCNESSKNAVSNEEDYYKQYPAELIHDKGRTKLPPINEKHNGEIDRLDLENDHGHNTGTEVHTFQDTGVQTEENSTDEQTTMQEGDIATHSLTNDVLQPLPAPGKKTLTPLETSKLATSRKEKSQAPKSRLKYTQSSFKDKIEAMWSQNQSVNTF